MPKKTPVATKPTPANLRDGQETVLLAVTGMSPAVLTETVWALANPTEPDREPVIPHRVIAVTTSQGRARLAELFEPSRQLGGVSPWDALRAALAAAGHDLTGKLRFGQTPNDIRVITALDPASGRSTELRDIRNRADNEATADFILEQVRAVVENPDTHLIVSIAGGRKTMSALLYACMTLLGRDTDQLTHVLVSEPFETLPDFWFPSQPGGPLPAHARSAHSARSVRSVGCLSPAAAQVDLAFVPFVPLRNLFERELGRKAGTFSRLVEDCSQSVLRRAAENLRLIIETLRPEIEVNGKRIRLSPRDHLLLLFLARRAKHSEPPYPAYKGALDDLNAFREELRSAPKDFNDWRHGDSLSKKWEPEDINKALSALRDKLRNAGGDAALLAACLPRKGGFALNVPGQMIQIK